MGLRARHARGGDCEARRGPLRGSPRPLERERARGEFRSRGVLLPPPGGAVPRHNSAAAAAALVNPSERPGFFNRGESVPRSTRGPERRLRAGSPGRAGAERRWLVPPLILRLAGAGLRGLSLRSAG